MGVGKRPHYLLGSLALGTAQSKGEYIRILAEYVHNCAQCVLRITDKTL